MRYEEALDDRAARVVNTLRVKTQAPKDSLNSTLSRNPLITRSVMATFPQHRCHDFIQRIIVWPGCPPRVSTW